MNRRNIFYILNNYIFTMFNNFNFLELKHGSILPFVHVLKIRWKRIFYLYSAFWITPRHLCCYFSFFVYLRSILLNTVKYFNVTVHSKLWHCNYFATTLRQKWCNGTRSFITPKIFMLFHCTRIFRFHIFWSNVVATFFCTDTLLFFYSVENIF